MKPYLIANLILSAAALAMGASSFAQSTSPGAPVVKPQAESTDAPAADKATAKTVKTAVHAKKKAPKTPQYEYEYQ